MSDLKERKKGSKKLMDSVKARLTLIIVAIMAVPLIATIIISYVSSHKEAIKNMDEMNTAQVELVEHDFKTVVDRNYQVLQTVANSVSARKVLLGELDRESVQDWLAKTDATVGDGNVLVIVDANGMQIVKSSGECIDVSEREYFKRVKADGKFYVSDQNISKTTGARICTFIYPVVDLDGSFIGAVQRNINLSDFTQLVKDEVASTNQDIFIGDNNGDLIAHTTMDLDTGEPVNFAVQKWYTESRSSSTATGSYDSTFNGGNWRMSYEREPVTGWVTVIATDVDVALASSNKMLMIVIILGIVMLIAASLLSVYLANSFTRPILAVNETIEGLAVGEFEKITDMSLVSRRDEFGDIVKNINKLIDKLSEVVGNLKNVMKNLGESSYTLAESADQISKTADDVSSAIEDIARGATDQADTVQRASDNIGMLSDAIQEVANNSQNLAETASSMNDQSQSSAEAMSELTRNMGEMSRAMEEIAEGMNATNAAVQSVNERVDSITSIASQTNLLALNASIESARAGEAGRGFAVVAEEIGKLATESADTTNEIHAEMERLLKQSESAIAKSGEVSRITKNVNEVLENTVNRIEGLIGGVDTTVDGVSTISGLAQESAASKSIILDAMDSLSAISEENAASAEETSASMQELNATVNVLSQSAGDLNDLAKQLEEDLNFFKI